MTINEIEKEYECIKAPLNLHIYLIKEGKYYGWIEGCDLVMVRSKSQNVKVNWIEPTEDGNFSKFKRK